MVKHLHYLFAFFDSKPVIYGRDAEKNNDRSAVNRSGNNGIGVGVGCGINDAEHKNGLLRSVWKKSTQLAAMDSRIEMHDVSVAKIAVMKKRASTNVPALPRFTSFLT